MHKTFPRWGATLLLMLLLPTGSGAASFADTQGHPQDRFISQLAKRGLVQGYSNGTFRPNATVNRAEFLKTLLLAVYGREEYDPETLACFRDFRGPIQWYWPYACAAKSRGFINGYLDGTFQGERTVNLAEAVKMMVLAWDVPLPQYSRAPDTWYQPYFDAAADLIPAWNIPTNPAHTLTRGDMAQLLVTFGQPLADVSDPERLAPTEPEPSPQQPAVCGNGQLETGEQCDDGNLQNGDGCSSICVIVEEPVYHGALQVQERTTPGGDVAPGEQGIILQLAQLAAGRQDVRLTSLTYRAQSGSLTMGENYRLYAGSELLDVGVVEGNHLSFDDIELVVREGSPVLIELRADIRSTAETGEFSVEFAYDTVEFIQAIGLEDGRDLTGITVDGSACTGVSVCWIDVRTVDRVPLQIVGGGNLYITVASPPGSSHQLLAGSEPNVDLLRVHARSDGEAITVDQLNFTGVLDSFERLEIYRGDIANAVATATHAGCAQPTAGKMCAPASFTIPRNSEVTLFVRGELKADTEGAESGESGALQLAVDGVEAHGLQSQRELDLSDGDSTAEGEIFVGTGTPGTGAAISGPTHDVVLAKFGSISNASSDPDGTTVPTGESTIGEFSFAALANQNTENGRNAATVQSLTFTVNASNVSFQAGSFHLINALAPSVQAECTADKTTGNITVTCANLHQEAIDTVAQSGESIVLSLRGTVASPQITAGSSTLQVSLNSLGNRASGGTVVWSDGVTQFTWVDSAVTSVRSTTYRF